MSSEGKNITSGFSSWMVRKKKKKKKYHLHYFKYVIAKVCLIQCWNYVTVQWCSMARNVPIYLTPCLLTVELVGCAWAFKDPIILKVRTKIFLTLGGILKCSFWGATECSSGVLANARLPTLQELKQSKLQWPYLRTLLLIWKCK